MLPSGVRPDDYRLTNLNIVFYIESVPFSRAVIEGKTSLGGSESAAVGLAKHLASRGHDVHIFAAQLTLDPTDPSEYDGVSWHPAEHLPETLSVCAPDVFVSLRMTSPFAMRTRAGLNLLWNQDMLADVAQVASALTQVDTLVYVSQYHRQQWEGKQKDIVGGTPSWVTKNGFDHTLIPVWPEHYQPSSIEAALAGGLAAFEGREVPHPVRNRHKYCYISRPERGLDPLLKMWPRIRERYPDAELHLCRYDSMYDAQGWHKVCEQYDRRVAAVNEKVGGIVWHGNLAKPDLYQLLTTSRLMLYPGVDNFAETSCIAALEAQACGCVLIGSYKGALPETVGEGAGVLIEGDAMSAAYQDSFLEAVFTLSGGDEGESQEEADELYSDMQQAGKAHVFPAYTFETIAQEWETFLVESFERRYQAEKLKVLRRLLHDDHHVAAKLVARDLIIDWERQGEGPAVREGHVDTATEPWAQEAWQAHQFCDRVIRQEEQTAEDYAEFSMDTELEARTSYRLLAIVNYLKEAGIKTLLDVACGNGSLALAALRAMPDLRVCLVDYSQGVLAKALTAIDKEGLKDRVTFLDANLSAMPSLPVPGEGYDAVFCGEYLEHTAEPHLVIDWLESHVKPGGLCLITCPHGPLSEHIPFRTRLQRGHTHHFQLRDITMLFQGKQHSKWEHIDFGPSPRGNSCGHWIIQWRRAEAGVEAHPSMSCDHWHTILTTRPYQRLIATMMVRDSEEWLFRCLHSIWPLVDATVIIDTGSTDGTKAVAAQFPHVHVHDHTALGLQWPQCGFSAVRNQSVRLAEQDHQADWILWIDADEHLQGGHLLHTLLTGAGPYLGYIIRQHHLMLDFDQFFDVPCRVFRANRGIQFYGLVHEQPETKKNEAVFPALDVPSVNIVHYGYETEPIRIHKMAQRNLPLLQRELIEDPEPRELAYVLIMRDLTVLAGYEGADSQLTPKIYQYLTSTIAYYDKYGFSDPAHRLHPLAYKSYQLALKWLGVGFEVLWGVGAGRPRLNTHQLKPEVFYARTVEEAQSLLAWHTKHFLTPLKNPEFDTMVYAGARPSDVPAPDPQPAKPELVLVD